MSYWGKTESTITGKFLGSTSLSVCMVCKHTYASPERHWMSHPTHAHGALSKIFTQIARVEANTRTPYSYVRNGRRSNTTETFYSKKHTQPNCVKKKHTRTHTQQNYARSLLFCFVSFFASSFSTVSYLSCTVIHDYSGMMCRNVFLLIFSLALSLLATVSAWCFRSTLADTCVSFELSQIIPFCSSKQWKTADETEMCVQKLCSTLLLHLTFVCKLIHSVSK